MAIPEPHVSSLLAVAEATEQGYEEKWKSAPIAADIMASRLRCSWTPKQ